MKKQSRYLVLGMMLLGAVMRVPFTAIPAVLTDVAQGLGVPVSSLGLLTSLPLLMFASCSALAPKWAEKLGIEQLLGWAVILMAAGSLMRVFSVPTLYLGTMLVGVAVAIINVLFPSLVSVNFPQKVGFYTTLYITMMGSASTVASMVAVPIVSATSWQFFILLITGLLVITALVWLPNWKYNHRFERQHGATKPAPLWKNPYALVFLVFGGLQSMLFYTEMTWLPTIAQTIGLSKAEAGFLAGVYSLVSIPVSMVIPSILSRMKKEQRSAFMCGSSLLTLLGLGMMLVVPVQFSYWLLVTIILSASVSALFPYMMLSFSLKTSNSQDTARLSGMVQSGGYLIASIGPVVLGYSYATFHSWTVLIWSLIVVTVAMMATIVVLEKKEKIV